MEAPTPTYADLVLIGGGHAHVHLLKMFGMLPYKALLAGIRLTLITRDINTPYSGMLPGYVAGHYTSTECHLDLSKLCSFSNFRLIHAEATAITLNTPTATSGLVHLSSSRPPLRFDCLSVDIGSSPTLSPLATINITPVKPIDSFSTRFHDLLRRATDHDATHGTPFRLIIVGGGAGGIELTLSLQHRLRALFTDLDRDPGLVDVCIVNRSQTLLPAHSDGVRTIFKRILKERDVTVHTDATALSTVTSASSQNLLKLSTGTLLPYDECIWCTNAAAAEWLAKATPCATTADGFLKISDTFQTNVPSIFAAGDCAVREHDPRPKAGVFAVRAGAPLRDNMIAYLLKRDMIEYTFQTEFLGLISTGDKYAVASRGEHALEGAFLWDLKDQIDKTWMDGYQNLPEMDAGGVEVPAIVAARGAEAMMAFHAAPMRCGGCGAKVGASTLSRVLERLGLTGDMDDCAICPPPPVAGSRSVHTIDFFRSFISDPFVFGRVAAVHALSDCHAMGAQASTALALCVCQYAGNEAVTEDTLTQMLAGANEALKEDGCRLVGGHTCEGMELGLGFAVNGFVSPTQKVLRKRGGGVGDKIVLTKALGTGATFASEMRGGCDGAFRDEAVRSMCLGNGKGAVEIVKEEWECTSCTDVTGFGFMGHLVEMLGDGVGASIVLGDVPFLRGGLQAAVGGIYSSLQKSNENARRAVVNHTEAAREGREKYKLLFDPQTSGGLLITVAGDRVEEFVERLREVGYGEATVVGELVEMKGGGGGGEAGGGEEEVCELQKKVVRVVC